MAITLADAKLNTTDDIDMQVIDEFSKSSWLLDNMTFDDGVNPADGGATLTYGYTRLVAERGAAFRPLNTEPEGLRTLSSSGRAASVPERVLD